MGIITVNTLTADEYASINNNNRGLRTVLDHEDPISAAIEGNPGNTAILPRDITVPANRNMAFVNTSLFGINTNVTQLVNSLYPDGLPPDVRLVLLGAGPGNTAIGRTMQSPPFDTNVDTSKVYNRFVCVFTVYNPREGRRSQLKAVLDPRGRILNRQLSEFYQSTNPD